MVDGDEIFERLKLGREGGVEGHGASLVELENETGEAVSVNVGG